MTRVPRVDKIVAIIATLINLILPGFGSLIAACFASENVSKTQMFVSLF